MGERDAGTQGLTPGMRRVPHSQCDPAPEARPEVQDASTGRTMIAVHARVAHAAVPYQPWSLVFPPLCWLCCACVCVCLLARCVSLYYRLVPSLSLWQFSPSDNRANAAICELHLSVMAWQQVWMHSWRGAICLLFHCLECTWAGPRGDN